MRVVAIIQARMGSSRLPGKVLRPLVGKPVLWHIIHRLRKCETVDDIAIATSTELEDDALVEFARSEGVHCARGPEDNVLERYALAAEETEADIIIRVTGDAPLVDSEMVDQLVRALWESGADYATGDPDQPCIHEGFSPFTRRALERLVDEASADPIAREHVTAYLKEHPDFVSTVFVPIAPEHCFRGARISVDTPADIKFIEKIYERLGVVPGEADIKDVVALLRAEPELLAINAHVRQKTAGERGPKVIIRCDGDQQIGLGHIVRCLALADELREKHACGVVFAMSAGPLGFEMVRGAHYPVIEKGADQEEAAWLDNAIKRERPDILVFDIRTDLPLSAVRRWRESGLETVVIDDPSERRLGADLAYYPPVPQVQEMDWSDLDGELYADWPWVILSRGFADCSRLAKKTSETLTILVTMGGSDPAGLTPRVLEALDRLDAKFNTVVIVGPGFSHDVELDAVLAGTTRNFDIKRNVADMPGLMAQADLAVASFGVTAYELAACGVPAIYLCLTKDHARSAQAFVNAGIGVSLGFCSEVAEGDISAAVGALLADGAKRRVMSEAGCSRLDGKGARRIVDATMQTYHMEKPQEVSR